METKMFEKIMLDDGREGIVVDCIGADILIVEVLDDEGEWDVIEVIDFYGRYEIVENEKVYTLNSRKSIRMRVTEDETYRFLTGDKFIEESFVLNKEEYKWLCLLLEIDMNYPEKEWHRYFEYHNFTPFINAYRLVTSPNGYYYAYGFDAVEKNADALYRCVEGRFERYFPREGIWREMPEQRMILNDKYSRHQKLTTEEGMALALL